MDHSEAMKLHAAERYVLGELSASQRDAFEDHYFSCLECAADVKAAAAFADNTREAMRGGSKQQIVAAPRPAPSRGWLWWLRPGYAMGAIALLLITVGYQNLVMIPKMKRSNSAQALTTYSLVTSGSRAAEGATEITIRRNTPVGIYVDIPASEKFSSYSCEVRGRDGSTKVKIDVSAEQARDAVQMFIPGGTLKSEQYELVVSGNRSGGGAAGKEEVARHTFMVKELP